MQRGEDLGSNMNKLVRHELETNPLVTSVNLFTDSFMWVISTKYLSTTEYLICGTLCDKINNTHIF